MELEVVINYLVILKQKYGEIVFLQLFADKSWCICVAREERETLLFSGGTLQELEKLINDNK